MTKVQLIKRIQDTERFIRFAYIPHHPEVKVDVTRAEEQNLYYHRLLINN